MYEWYLQTPDPDTAIRTSTKPLQPQQKKYNSGKLLNYFVETNVNDSEDDEKNIEVDNSMKVDVVYDDFVGDDFDSEDNIDSSDNVDPPCPSRPEPRDVVSTPFGSCLLSKLKTKIYGNLVHFLDKNHDNHLDIVGEQFQKQGSP